MTMATPVTFTTLMLNSDGTPMANTLIYVYNAGVANLAKLSSNSSGTAIANPVPTDASGNLTFFAPTGVYTLTGYDQRQNDFNQDVYVTGTSSNNYAANVAVTAAATTLAVVMSVQPDNNYSVQATPSWNTTVFITAKTSVGFTVNFGTAAPASSTVDWVIFR